MKAPGIDIDRLWTSLTDLAKVGAYEDQHTGLWGVNRLALTAADGQGRALLRRWFEEAGLEVRVDRIGNCFGRRRGTRDEAPVLLGSHIDSVPTAGAFDGCLGVLGALEVVRVLNERGVKTGRPIELAFFTDEEGARFGTDMLGSAVAVGRIPLEQALGLRDRSGLSVRDELAAIGFLGTHPERLAPPHAYLELHIEQGPILRAEGFELGVVSGVQAISWQELTIVGKSAHAGTTPMNLRQDAGLLASRLNVELHQLAVGARFGELRATMGAMQPWPGMVNIVPGRVVCTVDLRNPSDEHMAAAEKHLAELLVRLGAESGMRVEARQTARTPRIAFDGRIQELLAQRMTARGYSHRAIMSGAGHDAQELSSLCPAAMIFVPGEYDGISHNPREYSTKAQCERGANVLLDAVLELSA